MYLDYFKQLKAEGIEIITSPIIASRIGYSEEQVRKDLQAISKRKGVNKKGRRVDDLIEDLEWFLGYRKTSKAIIVGIGHLGLALLNFEHFDSVGLSIVAGFDKNPNIIGTEIAGKKIYDLAYLKEKISEFCVDIAIITVPKDEAQDVANLVIEAGVKGIWNFAPTILDVNKEIAVENVNLASSFAILSYKLDSSKEGE